MSHRSIWNLFLELKQDWFRTVVHLSYNTTCFADCDTLDIHEFRKKIGIRYVSWRPHADCWSYASLYYICRSLLKLSGIFIFFLAKANLLCTRLIRALWGVWISPKTVSICVPLRTTKPSRYDLRQVTTPRGHVPHQTLCLPQWISLFFRIWNFLDSLPPKFSICPKLAFFYCQGPPLSAISDWIFFCCNGLQLRNE